MNKEEVKIDYHYPDISLLRNIECYIDEEEEADEICPMVAMPHIVSLFDEYNVKYESIQESENTNFTLYQIKLCNRSQVTEVKKKSEEILHSLSVFGTRISFPIDGNDTILLEVPHSGFVVFPLKVVLGNETFKQDSSILPIIIGKSITDKIIIKDLTKVGHIIIAGNNEMNVVTSMNTAIISLLFKRRPDEVKFVLVDTCENTFEAFGLLDKAFFAVLPTDYYKKWRHVIEDTHRAIEVLKSLIVEMDRRYDMCYNAKVRNSNHYNAIYPNDKMPPIVVAISMFDKLITESEEFESYICRLAQLGRAVGIHLIISTLQPDVAVSDLIKVDFPTRWIFKTSNVFDSMAIMNTSVSSKLLDLNDSLFLDNEEEKRIYTPMHIPEDIANIVKHVNYNISKFQAYMLPEPCGIIDD